jgi:threonine synthase
MSSFLGYRCSICQKEYGPDEVTYTCPQDGGNLDVVLDYKRINQESSADAIMASAENSIWRYLPLLPVDDPGHEGTPFRAVGWTPMFTSSRLSERLGLPNLWLKDDGKNPTASFKDRASAVTVARAEAIGAEVVVTASTGNAGAALAGMAAAAGVPAVILAPKTAPQAKIAQLLIFGATVILVDGTYDDAFDLTLEAASAFDWYCRNTGYNPFTAEGKKTAAFEICEQFTGAAKGSADHANTPWMAPDAVFVSVGDGNIISGLHKGFKDLLALEWIDRVPRIFGVQSEGSSAIYNAFAAGTEDIQPVSADTLADSISVDLPRDGLRALRAATQTDGAYIQVTDEAILAAIRELAREAGVFAEPAGSTSYAGFVKAAAEGLVKPEDRIVVLNTGNGLKDVKAAMQAAGEATVIEPTLAALKQAIR